MNGSKHVRCAISGDGLDLCVEPAARYAAADRSDHAGFGEIAERLRETARTITETHLAEQALRESRRRIERDAS